MRGTKPMKPPTTGHRWSKREGMNNDTTHLDSSDMILADESPDLRHCERSLDSTSSLKRKCCYDEISLSEQIKRFKITSTPGELRYVVSSSNSLVQLCTLLYWSITTALLILSQASERSEGIRALRHKRNFVALPWRDWKCHYRIFRLHLLCTFTIPNFCSSLLSTQSPSRFLPKWRFCVSIYTTYWEDNALEHMWRLVGYRYFGNCYRYTTKHTTDVSQYGHIRFCT